MENIYAAALVIGLIIFIFVITIMILKKTNANKSKKDRSVEKKTNSYGMYVVGFIVIILLILVIGSLVYYFSSKHSPKPPRRNFGGLLPSVHSVEPDYAPELGDDGRVLIRWSD